MLRKFAAGLLATALIAGPAFAQTSTPSTTSGSAPTTAPINQVAPANAATAPAKATPAPANTMAAPAVTKTKETANPSKTVKHAKLHKKTVKHVVSRSHLKSGKMHQARHAKTHQVNTGSSAKRS
jgi:hypothetical protein